MAIRILCLSLIIFSLEACATFSGVSDNTETGLETPADRLAARDLAPGECGMFIWTADRDRRFILFSQMETADAKWWSKSGEISIRRISAEGFSSYRQPPQQYFNMPDGGTLMFDLADPEEINNGTRYKSGAITLVNSEGWEKVIPVVGLAGCQVTQS